VRLCWMELDELNNRNPIRQATSTDPNAKRAYGQLSVLVQESRDGM